MSDQEINIAIAEEMGEKWKRLDGSHHPYKWTRNGIKIMPHIIPSDYCNDLNAMHEAEKMLTEGSWKEVIHATNKYTNELCKVIGCLDTALFQFAHATARQRAEAFLRTIGKWEEKE